jgi:Amt family ammonium transporter
MIVGAFPAAGFIGPGGALLIGISAGAVCLGAVIMLKNVLKWDDSLDVVGVHLVGGALGTLLAGVFANRLFGGQESFSILLQMPVQLIGVVVTVIYTIAVSWVILAIVNAMVRQRVSEATLTDGLDVALHNEWGYVLDGPSAVASTDN